MSNQKYTPMQILQDNIKQKINQLEGHEQVRWIAEMEAYRAVLDMIQGDSLGKPLLEQEAELLGIETELEEKLPYKSQVVWGKNVGDEKWYIGHFVKKEFKNYILNTTVDDENTGGNFTIITTKNPYEVEEDREPQIGDMVFAWDNEIINTVVCGELENIYSAHLYPFALKEGFTYKHCSLKNPLIK